MDMVPPLDVASAGDAPVVDPGDRARLEARIAELERALAAREAPAKPATRPEFAGALYEAMLYGLGRTLMLYDPRSVDILVREMGRRIREYLEDELGYHIGGAPKDYSEFVKNVTEFFVGHGFVDLELLGWESDDIHARWHNLLGIRAYQRLAAAGGEVFISCPLNAVLHDGLAAFGKQLQLRRKEFDLGQRVVESWEQIVDTGPEPAPRHLSLDPERVLELEREQGRQVRMRDEFIRIASHELATPLTSTKLALRRLEGLELPESADRSVAVLKRQVRRLEQLVTEMLDATRLQTSRLRLERAPADLVLIVRQVIDLLRPEDGQQIRLTSVPSLIGRWDAARLDQVFTNLLSNAIKYGEGRPIDVEVSAVDGRARLTVHDRGIGIPAEAMERIFNAFERAVPVEAYAGLGLGLYIARKFVEMHHGTISAASGADGTIFTVELPLDCDILNGLVLEPALDSRPQP